MVYQEQVSRLVNRLGGVPLRRAFRLAKAISKKKARHDRPPSTRAVPQRRGRQSGVKRDRWPRRSSRTFSKFGSYAFNKAHSTGYAVVAYKTAYLKTYYPVRVHGRVDDLRKRQHRQDRRVSSTSAAACASADGSRRHSRSSRPT